MELVLPEYAKYVYEINCLRLSVAKVLGHRDALKYHICRYIELDYMLKVGALEYKQCLIENKVEKAKRMLYYLQDGNAKPEALPELIKKEFEEKDQKAVIMGDAINNAIDMSLEKIPTEEEITELNSHYLVLLRDYSPELNIKNGEEEKTLFEEIQKAYILCDLKAIKKYEKLKKDELFFYLFEEYKKEKIRLQELLSNTNKEIAKIKNTFPYTEKLSIQDENLFRRRKETINARTNELEDELKLLQNELRKF